ncbi:MAG: hypothetical protein AAB373_04450 [Patescibacteria group bacterium]
MSKRNQDHGIRDDARAFIGSTEHICPFATLAERNHEVAYGVIDDKDVEGSMRKTLERFLTDKKAAVLAFSRRVTDLKTSEDLAIRYMVAAGTVLNSIQNPKGKLSDIRDQLARGVGDIIRDPNSEYHPHLMAKHPKVGFPDNIFTIFMGPCYEKTHTRWAPHPMLVLTWATDVNQATITGIPVVKQIHERIRRAFGGRYDADALFVKPTPEITGA